MDEKTIARFQMTDSYSALYIREGIITPLSVELERDFNSSREGSNDGIVLDKLMARRPELYESSERIKRCINGELDAKWLSDHELKYLEINALKFDPNPDLLQRFEKFKTSETFADVKKNQQTERMAVETQGIDPENPLLYQWGYRWHGSRRILVTPLTLAMDGLEDLFPGLSMDGFLEKFPELAAQHERIKKAIDTKNPDLLTLKERAHWPDGIEEDDFVELGARELQELEARLRAEFSQKKKVSPPKTRAWINDAVELFFPGLEIEEHERFVDGALKEIPQGADVTEFIKDAAEKILPEERDPKVDYFGGVYFDEASAILKKAGMTKRQAMNLNLNDGLIVKLGLFGIEDILERMDDD